MGFAFGIHASHDFENNFRREALVLCHVGLSTGAVPHRHVNDAEKILEG